MYILRVKFLIVPTLFQYSAFVMDKYLPIFGAARRKWWPCFLFGTSNLSRLICSYLNCSHAWVRTIILKGGPLQKMLNSTAIILAHKMICASTTASTERNEQRKNIIIVTEFFCMSRVCLDLLQTPEADSKPSHWLSREPRWKTIYIDTDIEREMPFYAVSVHDAPYS